MTTQSFIITVHIVDYLKGQPLSPVDQILLSLGLVRMFLQVFSLFDAFLSLFFRHVFPVPAILFLYLMSNASNLSNIWLTTVFSVTFCLKIANFHTALFLRLKATLSQQVVRLIVVSVLLSICFISLFLWVDSKVNQAKELQGHAINETEYLTHVYIFVAMGNSFPFIIYSSSTILLITSLFLHMRQMKSNANVTANLDTYYEAIKFMSFCLLCFVLLVGTNVTVLHYYKSLDVIALFIFWNAFPTLHSIYLIYRTNKLREHFLRILHRGTNGQVNGRNSEPKSRSQVETISR
ncbi:PREDICTED: taste receptor type 2 member 40-like [Nanorana parkeri]|uniref:taste receptor type 2 member 40-like n=1 Tax=Nanorana parkeri TaxID=125878 RepID=UPI000854D1E9|nr:PREDICTED: taste receptor type 2 member 40-like [Nanorana parkeri]